MSAPSIGEGTHVAARVDVVVVAVAAPHISSRSSYSSKLEPFTCVKVANDLYTSFAVFTQVKGSNFEL